MPLAYWTSTQRPKQPEATVKPITIPIAMFISISNRLPASHTAPIHLRLMLSLALIVSDVGGGLLGRRLAGINKGQPVRASPENELLW
jgi:hypothetical protein